MLSVLGRNVVVIASSATVVNAMVNIGRPPQHQVPHPLHSDFSSEKCDDRQRRNLEIRFAW